MSLTIHQKSVYLIIFNATMISRSVGKSIKGKSDIKDFKIRVFEEIEKLTGLMDDNKLEEDDIVNATDKISNEFQISWGQAQKPINVILKYHFYLTRKDDDRTKKILYCPLDSIILEKIGKEGLCLTNIQKEQYLEIQKDIDKLCNARIEFDSKWDEQHLQAEGLLNNCEPSKKMGVIMRIAGKTTWTNEKGNPIDSGKVTEAIIRDNEIAFDFIQENKKHNAKLISRDGIYYNGEYELNKIRKGKADFKLYENKTGYFLFGNYEGHMPEEGRGLWWVELDKSQ